MGTAPRRSRQNVVRRLARGRPGPGLGQASEARLTKFTLRSEYQSFQVCNGRCCYRFRGNPWMSRITIPDREVAPAASQPILDSIYKQAGFVPNLFRLMALSPAVLNGQANFQSAMTKALDLKTRVKIALAVSQVNQCDYCLAAHTYHALNQVKIPPDEIAMNRSGRSLDAKTDAALRFAVKVTQLRGHIEDSDLRAVRDAGYTDAQVLEIIAVGAAYMLTNLINNVADTDIDFPDVDEADVPRPAEE
jgi:uncharacterized peroxidase-related enzyme